MRNTIETSQTFWCADTGQFVSANTCAAVTYRHIWSNCYEHPAHDIGLTKSYMVPHTNLNKM